MGSLNPPQLDIARQKVAEAEEDVARQRRLMEHIEKNGHSMVGARTLLRLFEDILEKNREALALIENASVKAKEKGWPGQATQFRESRMK